MRPSAFTVVHLSPRVQARGGIEALHVVHRALPGQRFVALFDRRPEPRDDYVNLNFTWRTTLGAMRRAVAHTFMPHAGSVVIYHNAWGLPLFHAEDRAARRLIFCHANPAYLRRDLTAAAGLVDGALGVTSALIPAWTTDLRLADAQRGCVIPLPVALPSGIVRRSAGGGQIVLGYAGRVEREQKRLDRLPAFLQALHAAGVRARFEVLGEGSLRSALESRLAGQVRFHGWQEGDAYWRIVREWDGIVFFSDFEGSPIALNEALAIGLIPFFPNIGGTTGDLQAAAVDSRCHYPPGDMPGLAARVASIFAEPERERETLRERARGLVTDNTVANYAESLTAFLQQIEALPRMSAPGRSRRRWSDPLPLGLVARVAPWLLRQR